MASALDKMEKTAAELRRKYLHDIKEDLRDMIPAMGYEHQEFAELLGMSPASFSRFLNEEGKCMNRERMLQAESWLDKANVTLDNMEKRKTRRLRIRGS